MDFGICMFPTDFSMQATELAVAVEERGFDALFIPDHTHIPASRETAARIPGELPADYSHNVDMFLGLAAAAAVTKRIRLGTGICLVPERDPIITAKEVASLDHISGGRVDFGVGGGWNKEEFLHHGRDWGKRFKIMRERIEAMQAIWTNEVASYHGEYVNFDEIWSWPKPVQKPWPPIFVGGDAPKTLDRVLNYGDGWIPMLADDPQRGVFDLKLERMSELNRLAAERGRGPLPITTFGTPRDPETIEKLAAGGVTRCVFGIAAAKADTVLPRLDKLARLADEMRGRIAT